MKVIKKTVVDILNRGVLSEGRSSGMGFAMLKKNDNTTFETVNPTSPCKDYLAEVVFTENYKIPTNAHGLDYPKPKDILNEDVSYLFFKNMTSKGGGFNVENKTFEQYSEEMLKGYKNIEAFINKFQSSLDGKFVKCKIEAVDNGYLVIFDTRWTCSSYSISLFTLLLRIGRNYVKTTPALTYIESVPNSNIDYSLIKTAMNNIKIVLENKKLPNTSQSHLDAVAKKGYVCPHNDGICAWKGVYTNIK